MSRHHRDKLPPPHVWNVMRCQCFARDGYQCVACGARSRLECDHVVPISEGGTHELGNLRTLCRACHIADTRARHQPHVAGQSEWGEFASSTGMKRRRHGPEKRTGKTDRKNGPEKRPGRSF